MVKTTNTSHLTILVVDDEEDVNDVITLFLSQEGYNVINAFDGEEAIAKATSEVDLIVLDIMLPKIDGFEVCRRLRSRVETEMIPIIFLSAKGEEEDHVRGLMLGADVYLAKPVSPQVLVANVKAVIRRAGVEESRTLTVKDLTIFEEEYRAEYHGKDLGLTLTEFELLMYLVRHPRKAFTRIQLLDTIWKDAMMVTERTVDAHIKNLREKLGTFSKYIQTVRGVGYRFVEEEVGEEDAPFERK
ncbi:MAG TPA: response regulator transcription factor [Rhodothermales bacterium]|nr:response regulator transcription factor [Rhodothermales bacterium]HRR10179.1 response regulator transcription factor [Rhodothermales bacterium]